MGGWIGLFITAHLHLSPLSRIASVLAPLRMLPHEVTRTFKYKRWVGGNPMFFKNIYASRPSKLYEPLVNVSELVIQFSDRRRVQTLHAVI